MQQLHNSLEERLIVKSKVNKNLIKLEVLQYDAKKSTIKKSLFIFIQCHKLWKIKLCANKTSDRFCYISNYEVFRIDNICKINNDINYEIVTVKNIK